MPDLVLSNEGERYLLDSAVSTPWTSPETWELHLYQNDYTPDRNVTLSSVVEASFPSYAAKTLIRATWMPAFTANGRAVSFYGLTPQQWLSSSTPQLEYGYYITVPSLAILLLAQRFDAPQFVTSLVPAIVLPVLSLHSESEP